MLFAVDVKYRYAAERLEVKHEDVRSLGRQDVWGAAKREGVQALCQMGGLPATAAYVTGVFLKKILGWVTVNTSENSGALFDLDIPHERTSEFQKLVKSDELTRLLNKELTNPDSTTKAELNLSDDCIRNLRIASISIVAERKRLNKSMADTQHAIAGVDMAEGYPIQIVKEGDDLEIDGDALEAILSHPNIDNRMVALVSIAGAFRQGKSFMLNFLLRYLRQKGYESNDETWLGDPDTLLDNGFAWRGGTMPHTSGIVIWSEPFIVPQGTEEVAIFLVDTQGEFDNRATRARSTNILAINFLLSSTVIYNVQEVIKGNDLENLEFCTWYAEEIKTGLNPFQNFWFLVRDWHSTGEFELGHLGGQEYLDKRVLVAGPSDPQSLISMRQNIRKSFESMGCYLMPFPGVPVMRMKGIADKPGKIHRRDIDPEFLTHVAKFADMLLNPKNLSVKPMKAQNLLNFIIKCCESINSDHVVAPDTILQNVLNARVIELRDECLKSFNEEMKKAGLGFGFCLGLRSRNFSIHPITLSWFNCYQELRATSFPTLQFQS